MAMARRFQCDSCSKSLEVWDEGHPYYRDENGKKVYAYHPSRERNLCTEYDSDIMCMTCGHLMRSDSAKPRKKCTKCKSEQLGDQYDLEGKTCPYCKKGTFGVDPEWYAIS